MALQPSRTVLISDHRDANPNASSYFQPFTRAERRSVHLVHPTMIRKAFVMSVHAGREQEYQRRHSPIWKELEAVLKQHGAHNYSIFLLSATRQLFAYVEVEDEARWAAIARTPECQRWWKYMGDIMPSNPDNSPVAQDLSEVFHLD